MTYELVLLVPGTTYTIHTVLTAWRLSLEEGVSHLDEPTDAHDKLSSEVMRLRPHVELDLVVIHSH